MRPCVLLVQAAADARYLHTATLDTLRSTTLYSANERFQLNQDIENSFQLFVSKLIFVLYS